MDNQIVFSTINCEIVEYRGSKNKLLTCGHFGK